ncbi:MAG TPA: hypothetical protein PLR41_04750 [Alphaproteobacteria bacterium]|nr:hypothetical protein [Alphaproteobacteria bacterium]
MAIPEAAPATPSSQALIHPKQDCQALVDASLPFAWKMLAEFGSFHPYAAAMKATGEIVSVAAQDGRADPPAADVIRQLRNAFTEAARNGEYRATAVFYDVFAAKSAQEPKTDAVAVALDHRDGYSVVTLYPYRIKDKALTRGEPFAQRGTGGIFPPRVLH